MNFDTRVANVDTEINSTNIKNMISDGVDRDEGLRIINFIEKSITPLPENLKKLVESLKLIEDERKILEDDTKKSLIKLINDIESGNIDSGAEKNTNINSFDDLEKSYENNKAMKEFMDLTGNYIDLKLDKNFTDSEKDKIKLVMLSEIFNSIDLNNLVGGTIKKLLEPLNALISSLKDESDKDLSEKTSEASENFNELTSKFNSMFTDFGMGDKIKDIEDKIGKINNAKKDNKINKKFDNIGDVFSIISPEKKIKNEQDFMVNLKNNADNLSGLLSKGRGLGDKIGKGLDSLPFELGGTIKNFIREKIKSGGIIGMILGLIFGKEFLDESGDKQKKSLKNLKKFSKSDNFPLKENIKPDDLKEFDSKKLEKFYKFLDVQKIDYTSKNFWPELLTGESKNKQIINLNKLLKNQDGKILDSNDDLDSLVDKLNGLGKQVYKKELKSKSSEISDIKSQITELQAKKTEEIYKINVGNEKASEGFKTKKILEKDNKPAVGDKNDVKIIQGEKTEESKKSETEIQDKIKELKEKKYQAELEKSIMEINKLPAEILYKGKKIELNIDNNQIILGENKYNIEVQTKYGNKFEKIEFNEGNFYINGETQIKKEQVKDLIVNLKENGNFSYKGKVKKPFIGEVDYELKIQKY